VNICDIDKDAIVFGYCALSTGEPSHTFRRRVGSSFSRSNSPYSWRKVL